MSDAATPTMSQVILTNMLFAALVLIACMPLAAIVWKSTGIRQWLWSKGCTSWVICCDKYVGESLYHDQTDLRTLRELQHGLGDDDRDRASSFYVYQSRRVCREPQMALHLASWREDVRSYSARDLLTMKLEQIQIVSSTEMPSSHCGSIKEDVNPTHQHDTLVSGNADDRSSL